MMRAYRTTDKRVSTSLSPAGKALSIKCLRKRELLTPIKTRRAEPANAPHISPTWFRINLAKILNVFLSLEPLLPEPLLPFAEPPAVAPERASLKIIIWPFHLRQNSAESSQRYSP